MHFMKHTTSLAVIGLLSAFGVVAGTHHARAEASVFTQEQLHQQRETFARDFADKVLAILQDTKKSFGDRKDVLRQAFSNSVDIDWIAKFVVGRTWNNATDAQRERYTALYRKFLTESYVTNFAENPDKRIRDIKIFGVNDNDSDRDKFTVRTQMQLADQEDVDVNYLVHDDQNGHYKVLDIVIENVSLITTHRSQFGAIASAQGIDTVIAKLEQLLDHKPGVNFSMNE